MPSNTPRDSPMAPEPTPKRSSVSPDAGAESEPPLSRFLVSLILLPVAVVLVGLALVVGFHWLTRPGTDPDGLVDTIENREGNVRWRAAVALAGLLADPDHGDLRHDRQLAARLAEVLRRELESEGVGKEDATLRVFLCRALGEFLSDASLPVLVDATGSQHGGNVRRSALEAIALLAGTLGSQPVGGQPGLKDSLLAASRDADPQVRLSAAYALGVLGGAESEDRLVAMLLDENTLVRYNAATGLARWGNATASEVLLEMLAPDQRVALGHGSDESGARSPEEMIHLNALRSIRQLASAGCQGSPQETAAAVARLQQETESPAVQAEIARLRPLLGQYPPVRTATDGSPR